MTNKVFNVESIITKEETLPLSRIFAPIMQLHENPEDDDDN